MSKTDTHLCSICQTEYTGFGNNAEPINTGRCCDVCNDLVVLARINRMKIHEVLKRRREQERLDAARDEPHDGL